jgi:hypothetical protein
MQPPNQNSMRINIKSALLAVGLTCGLFSQQAFGISLDTVYTSVLPSVFGGGSAVTVNWEVSTTLNAGFYTYEYQVNNPAATGTPNLDFFSLTFVDLPGTVLANNATFVTLTGVSWTFTPLALGGSTAALNTAGVLYFTSRIAPALGNGQAADAIPPSPFVGFDLGVPNVPDGGMTVAFLGFAFVGIEGLRRKLKK